MCAAGAVGGVAVVLSGRKPTFREVALGAAVGCGGGLSVLGAWAAGAAVVGAATASEAAGGVIITALTMREALMRAANHPSLVSSYRPTLSPRAKIGDAGTADLIRMTGHPGHIQKAVSRARQLEGMLRRQVLDAADSELAKIIVRGLRSVIPGSNK